MTRRISALFFLAFAAAAHDIPNDVQVRLFVKPEGRTLTVLVRVPLAALRDIDFPEKGPGYLDLSNVDAALREGARLWISDALEVYEGEERLAQPRLAAVRISLPSDRSFGDYSTALALLSAPPLPPETNLIWSQTFLDVRLEYAIRDDRARFSIHPGLARLGLRVLTVMRFLPAGTTDVRALEYTGDPGLVRLDPTWRQAAGRFVELGFFHILDGTDHLLFLLCLVIPFRRFRALVPVVTAFTVAHSITLIASAYDLAPDALWFPPLIEALIAASIVYMALENIVGGMTVHRRWMIAFGFGLVHGFGFSFALRETLQLAGAHMLTSLLSFNVGVELGQLLVLSLMIPLLELLFRRVVAERMGTIILSALVAHTGWHWMMERWEKLDKFHLTWPEMTADNILSILHWAMALVAVAGGLWLVSVLSRARRARTQE